MAPQRTGRGPENADRVQPTILYRETNEKYEPYAQPTEWTLPPLFFTEDQARLVAELATTIHGYVEQTFARAVIGDLDLDAEWERYPATLERMGLPQYLRAHQEAYDARPR